MPDNSTTLDDLKKKIQEFSKKRGWEHENPKDIALSLVLESAELLEHFQWIPGETAKTNERMRKAIGDEMSDVLWWIIRLADKLGIDIADAFEKKIEKNAKKYPEELFRPDMTQEEKNREYYRIKAATRGGHPLHLEDVKEDD